MHSRRDVEPEGRQSLRPCSWHIHAIYGYGVTLRCPSPVRVPHRPNHLPGHIWYLALIKQGVHTPTREQSQMGNFASKTPEPVYKVLLTRPAYEVRVSSIVEYARSGDKD